MQNVPPLPNEHVLGHLARVAGANAVKNLKALFRSTRSDDDNEDIHPLHWKHRYYGPLRYGNTTSLEEYRKHHTLTLFLTKPTQATQLANLGGFLSDAFVRHHIPLGYSAEECISRIAWRFCSQCRDVARNKFGIGYWHRVHQVPGMDICPYHGVVLTRCKIQAMFDDPTLSDAESFGTGGPDENLVAANMTPALHRYRTVIKEVLDHPLPEVRLRRAVLSLLRSSRMRTEEDRRTIQMPRLAAVVSRREIPDVWLLEHIPRVRVWFNQHSHHAEPYWREEFIKTCHHSTSKAGSDLWTLGLELLMVCLTIRNVAEIKDAIWPGVGRRRVARRLR